MKVDPDVIGWHLNASTITVAEVEARPGIGYCNR